MEKSFLNAKLPYKIGAIFNGDLEEYSGELKEITEINNDCTRLPIKRTIKTEKLNDVYFNRLFRKPDFLSYLFKYSHHLPCGLTIDTSRDKFVLCIKHYGYFSSGNTGLNEYDDLSDYISGNEKINPEIIKGILEYFKDNNPEIFNELSTKGIIVH